jgi:hypothetical protein
MASDSLKTSFQNSYHRIKSLLVRYSQATSFVVGLSVAITSAVLWYYNKVGAIIGSLFIGIGSSVIAAAIVAFLSPLVSTHFEGLSHLESIKSGRHERQSQSITGSNGYVKRREVAFFLV